MNEWECEFDWRVVSVANQREHWTKRSVRAAEDRRAGFYYMQPGVKLPCVITLTRIAFKQLDTDNLASAFKSMRDGIADRLKIEDNDSRVDWRYAQEKGGNRVHRVRIGYSQRVAAAA